MAELFAYITHSKGVADDSALELIEAAKKIDAGADVTAVVTGAGKGIGQFIALTFAEAGARVVFSARTEKDIQAGAERAKCAYTVTTTTNSSYHPKKNKKKVDKTELLC